MKRFYVNLCLLAVATLSLFSCNKDEDELNQGEASSLSTCIPVSVSSSDGSVVDYIYEDGKLQQTSNSIPGNYPALVKFIYDGDRLVEKKIFSGVVLTSREAFIYSNDVHTKTEYYYYVPKSALEEPSEDDQTVSRLKAFSQSRTSEDDEIVEVLVYVENLDRDSDGNVIKITSINNFTEELLQTVNYEYDESMNVKKETLEDATGKLVVEYSFDDKFHPDVNLSFTAFIGVLNKNNIISSKRTVTNKADGQTSSNNFEYNITYNENDFPEKIQNIVIIESAGESVKVPDLTSDYAYNCNK
ncbi:hypothetical protein [Aureibacter tunicatorum]|uniref:Lipoprotein n=1 Tax=Aureibacter tunicatorum TaxID=866807 RepID=A0AAE3XMP9_9BACT|nr:hypothetical protein [Aureibacter tunicatorum]MDR6239418.1 hypothetical protein [Aureibacter tunicatorum]BDD04659.1 hypothetical protein AUTU_21420 [Aureibacter tunicatorum]